MNWLATLGRKVKEKIITTGQRYPKKILQFGPNVKQKIATFSWHDFYQYQKKRLDKGWKDSLIWLKALSWMRVSQFVLLLLFAFVLIFFGVNQGLLASDGVKLSATFKSLALCQL